MAQRIGAVTLIVRDYDEALAYFVGRLGFFLIDDTLMGGDRRWVLVKPAESGESAILLAKADDSVQAARIGDQTGGRVALFLYTDDFWRDHARFKAAGVAFQEEPRSEAYGMVAVFADLYGNRWDLLEPKDPRDGLAV